MRSRPFLPLFLVVGLFETPAAAAARAATTLSSSDQSAASSQFENSVTIPGPLRSFLRMAGMRQKVQPPEVLPILARTVVLHGYQTGRATEYLILLRRYFRQAKELTALAGPDGNIRVNGCEEAQPLLRVLGYITQGE